MKIRSVLTLVFLTAILLSCNKNSNSSGSGTKIDVSAQWIVDASGALVSGTGDGQWQSKIFTANELNLFASLDTANLSGTTTPAAVQENAIRYNCIIPNPFNSNFQLYFHFTPGYAGQLVFKSVIVDNAMNPLFKKAERLQAAVYGPLNLSASNTILIAPNLPAGKYRLYYTLSSQANPHLYTSWGNIQAN